MGLPSNQYPDLHRIRETLNPILSNQCHSVSSVKVARREVGDAKIHSLDVFLETRLALNHLFTSEAS